METLWRLYEWNHNNQEAFLLFACTIFAVIGLCSTATLLKRKSRKKVMNKNQESSRTEWTNSEPAGWITIRSVLMGSMRWSGANRWEDASDESGFVGLEKCESSLGWQSHNSLSPVWQRPILMGEKCELPRHSGLILYDENGRRLDRSFTTSSQKGSMNQNQGTQIAGGTKTTLRDLFYY